MEKTIEERITAIEERNRRVELDKKWETSLARIVVISVITYLVAIFVLFILNAPSPFFSALIPVLGFVLSTQSIPFIKKYWLRNK